MCRIPSGTGNNWFTTCTLAPIHRSLISRRQRRVRGSSWEEVRIENPDHGTTPTERSRVSPSTQILGGTSVRMSTGAIHLRARTRTARTEVLCFQKHSFRTGVDFWDSSNKVAYVKIFQMSIHVRSQPRQFVKSNLRSLISHSTTTGMACGQKAGKTYRGTSPIKNVHPVGPP
jgi:hypothetical protein